MCETAVVLLDVLRASFNSFNKKAYYRRVLFFAMFDFLERFRIISKGVFCK